MGRFVQQEGSGRFLFADLLGPAAVLSEEGFPVGPVALYQWIHGMHQVIKWVTTDDSNDCGWEARA